MRNLLIALVLSTTLPLLAQDSVPETAEPRVSALGWLAGSWCARSESASAEEYWIAPHGGVMLGLHRDVRGGGDAFFEFLRIEDREDGVFYLASPAGREPTPFRLTESAGQRAVFENPEHDYPQRIIYERDGDLLTATIEGDVGGETRSSGWRWHKDACDWLQEAAE